MALKRTYATQDEIPEQYRDLFTERNGKYELTGVEGLKSQDDIDRLNTSLTEERDAHKRTKQRLRPLSLGGKSFVEMNDDELRGATEKLDGYEELVARAGKVDDGAIERIVESRVRTKLAPVERDRDAYKTQLDEANRKNAEYDTATKRRAIHDALREAIRGSKGFLASAEDDVLMLSERVFEVGDDNRVTARDGVGVTPGITPDAWLTEMQPKRQHWWEPAQGGGARGAKGGGGIANNPFSKENWNLTEQGRYIQQHGMEKAEAAAKAAGSRIGATAPPK